MKADPLAVLVACVLLAPVAGPAFGELAEQRLIEAPRSSAPYRVRPAEPPAGCPFEPSKDLVGLGFTGRHASYTGADTWYPSWAADGHLYSPWTDGAVEGQHSDSAGRAATTGQARILGDDPLHLKVEPLGVFKSDPEPYAGRYPCGSLVYNGVWYYGTYCLHPAGSVRHGDMTYNWPWLGPFVGFRYSTDFGQTWTQTPCTPERPLFDEHALQGEPVRIGAPHFVDFGKNLEHAPDGKAYLVAHGASDGATRRFAYNSWITGDEVYLLRVTPSIQNINDASRYEFFAGHDAAGQAVWARECRQSQPIAAWRDHMGCVTMTYDPGLKRYLLCVTDGGNTVSYFDTYVLEAARITGPFRLVTYLRHFGEQAYFANLPSKFIGADGRTLWLCYAANFSQGWNGIRFHARPAGSRYGMCLQEVRLLAPGDPVPAGDNPLQSAQNLAPYAKVTVSSVHADYAVAGATDGVVGGFPGNIAQEWATAGEKNTAMIRLTWDQPETIDRVWLFDRPNLLDHITGGMLVFSDGSTIRTEALPDDAAQGLEVRFAPRKVTWLAFLVTEVGPKTQNVGLAEFAVFAATPKP